MTRKVKTGLGASSASPHTWNSIDWKKVEAHVHRLQMRIAKAQREGRYGKVKSLQWILTHSYHAKLLAVKRVTQIKVLKIRADATPYDPAYKAYFEKRRRYKVRSSGGISLELETCAG